MIELLVGLGAVELGDDRPSNSTTIAVGHAEHLGQLGRDHQDRHALGRRARRAGGAPRPSCRRRCRASARRRSAATGRRASHLASTTFCWLPPESVQTGFVSRPYLSCSRGAQSAANRRSAAARDQPSRGARRERGERDVALDREVHHEPLLAAVLGHEPDPGRHRAPSASPAAARARRSPPRRRRSGRCRRSRARPRCGRRRRGPASATISPARTSNETSVKTPSRVSRSTCEHASPGSAATFGKSALHVAADHRRG